MADVKLNAIYKKVETLIKNRLKYQVPVGKGTKKKRGGALKRSIDVKVYEDDGIKWKSSWAEYGKFTNKGTGVYLDRGDISGKFWNPNPGPGKKGIKPRYWTNLDKATRQQISKLIGRETTKQIVKSISNK